MGVPRKDFSDQTYTVSMMELRETPGDIIDRVAHGATVHIEKNGKHVATIVPVETVIHPDGTWTGKRPLMMGIDL